MSGKVAIISQIMAAKTRPNGTIRSLFMTTSCDSVLAHQGAVGSPNLLGLHRPDLVVPRRRRTPAAPRPGHDRALAVQRLHFDDLDDDRVRIVVILIRDPQESLDDRQCSVLVPCVGHEVVTAGRIGGPLENLLRELPEGLADVGWPRILLFRQKSQGADNPLAL